MLPGIGFILESFWFRLQGKPTKSFQLLRQEDRFGSNCLLGTFGSVNLLGNLWNSIAGCYPSSNTGRNVWSAGKKIRHEENNAKSWDWDGETWNRLWDWLSNPFCWKVLKTEEGFGGCKGNWWYFGVGMMSEEHPRHTSVQYHCWKAMLAVVLQRGTEFREARWDRAGSGQGPCPARSLTGATGLAVTEESQLWDTQLRGPVCPSSCSSPPEAQALTAPLNFPFSALEVEVITLDQSFLLWDTNLKNHHKPHKVWC